MQEYIQKRVLEVGEFILETKATVRLAARQFNISKSTVHKDMTERLPVLDQQLSRQIRQVLELNKAERHLRGGEATRRKYRQKMAVRLKSASH